MGVTISPATVFSSSSRLDRLKSNLEYATYSSSRNVVDKPSEGPTVGVADPARLNLAIVASKPFDQITNNRLEAEAFLGTAIAAYTAITKQLETARSAAVKAASSNITSSKRASLANTADAAITNIDVLAKEVSYHGLVLLDGKFNDRTYRVDTAVQQMFDGDYDANDDTDMDYVQNLDPDTNMIRIEFNESTPVALDLETLSLSSATAAKRSVVRLDDAIDQINNYVTAVAEARRANHDELTQTGAAAIIAHETQKLSPDVNFETTDMNILENTAENRPRLTYLNSGVSIRKGTVSFKV